MVAKPKQNSKLKLTDKKQSERFKEIARTLNVEESEEFERIVKKIVRTKPKEQAT